jgi:RNA polymerase sigma-70 factor (ECF subfamily)
MVAESNRGEFGNDELTSRAPQTSKDPSEITDEALLAEVSRGQGNALADLYQRYSRSIRNLARRILHEYGEADELLQDVFLHISHKSALYDPSRGSARSWIFHVAYHCAFDRRRYLSRRHFYDKCRIDGNLVQDSVHANSPLLDQLAATNLVNKSGNLLSQQQRQIIHLHFVEGYSLREIAGKTDQTLGNVRNHYYRGLERLRSLVFKENAKVK